MIKILYCFFQSNFEERYSPLLDRIPKEVRQKAVTFKYQKDRLSFLVGRLLLLEGWRQLNLRHSLSDIIYNDYKKPLVDGSASFNISHSNNFVVCVISEKYKVGIDVEFKTKINFGDFNDQWTLRELTILNKSKDMSDQFYRFWTRKESIIKADGRGLSMPLNKIDVVHDVVYIDTNKWYLTELNIDNEYIAHLASNKPIESELKLERLYL